MTKTPPTQPQQSFPLDRMYVWVKGVETKVNGLLRELDVVRNDLVKRNKELRSELSVLTQDFSELKHKHAQLLQKVDLIVGELGRTAGKEEVQVLKRYVDIWNPLHFTTQRDVERIMEEKLQTKR